MSRFRGLVEVQTYDSFQLILDSAGADVLGSILLLATGGFAAAVSWISTSSHRLKHQTTARAIHLVHIQSLPHANAAFRSRILSTELG